MVTVSEALDRILATVAPLDTVCLRLSDALGTTLAEEIVAADDSPPFDKALMDGFAVRAADVASGFASLKVIEVVTAGHVPEMPLGPGEATQIMTGAQLPVGADLVVKVEETLQDIEHVHITTKSVHAGANIVRRGDSVRAGDVVLKAGMKLNGSRIGALAELGRAAARVHRRPTVAVLATGDELVAVDEQPGPGQIRNSNQSMLVAQLQAAGAIPVPLGIARDNRDDLRAKIQMGLTCDMLVLSGGVSAGTLDLVPGELAAAGVREVFHQVEIKPGKPLWFGVRTSPVTAPSGGSNVVTLETSFTLEEFRRMLKTSTDVEEVERLVAFHGNEFSKRYQQSPDQVARDIFRLLAILDAMSPWEWHHPDRIDSVRLARIAHDSGTFEDHVRGVLQSFQTLAKEIERVADSSLKHQVVMAARFADASASVCQNVSPTCYVFGLPGNPVSSLVCCELFVRTAIRRLMGETRSMPRTMPAKLEHDHQARGGRTTYHPAKLMWSNEGPVVKLVPWHGSSDLCGTVVANAMVCLPSEARQYQSGDFVETIAW